MTESSSAPATRPTSASPATVLDSPYDLAPAERLLLEQGKTEHRETTASAKRALQVAEKTADVARNTLVEMHRQGHQLERAEIGMHQVAGEIKEASAILRFMRCFCLFQCCDCLDPTLQQDRTRKQRVAANRQGLQFEQQNLALQYGAKQQAVDRLARQHDPAHGGSEGAARQELFAQAEAIRTARQVPRATDIGLGLPEDDRRDIQRETERQDSVLGRIGDAVESLHAMSKEMNGELCEQVPRIGRLQDRAAVTHDQLGSLAREAQRI